MKIIRSTLRHKPSKGEVNKGVSKTIPDDSWSVQELLLRHERGLGFGTTRNGMYDDLDEDEHDALDMNQFQNMDITEKMIVMNETREVSKKIQETRARKQAKKPENEPNSGNLDKTKE